MKKTRKSKRRSVLPKPVLVAPEGVFKLSKSRSRGTPREGVRAALTPEVNNPYQQSLRFVLRWEGGYVNDPDDPGGATNKGVTQKTYDGYRRKKGLPLRPVREITDAEVGDIYKTGYWDTVDGDRQPWPLCLVLFDTGVNMGPGRAMEFLGQAKKLLDSDPGNDALELARRVTDLRVNRYYALVQRNPRLKKFLKGWLNRARELKRVIGY